MPSTTQPRLITLGETMVMITPAGPEPLDIAEDVRLHIGGAESNVASHTAALGVSSAWASAVGDDALGTRILDALARRGVDLRWARRDPGARTGVYFKDPGRGVLYYRDGSAASRMSPETIRDLPLESAEIVHLSGITSALSASCAALIDEAFERVAASPARLSFDVNHRAALWPDGAAAPALLGLSNRADIVFVGLDEAQDLWGCATADDVRALLPGPARVVVKDGPVGATEFEGTGSVFAPAIPAEVVEPVGAGDAFAGGYLAALLAGADPRERLTAGHRRAHPVLASTSDFIAEPRRTAVG